MPRKKTELILSVVLESAKDGYFVVSLSLLEDTGRDCPLKRESVSAWSVVLY